MARSQNTKLNPDVLRGKMVLDSATKRYDSITMVVVGVVLMVILWIILDTRNQSPQKEFKHSDPPDISVSQTKPVQLNRTPASTDALVDGLSLSQQKHPMQVEVPPTTESQQYADVQVGKALTQAQSEQKQAEADMQQWKVQIRQEALERGYIATFDKEGNVILKKRQPANDPTKAQ